MLTIRFLKNCLKSKKFHTMPRASVLLIKLNKLKIISYSYKYFKAIFFLNIFLLMLNKYQGQHLKFIANWFDS